MELVFTITNYFNSFSVANLHHCKQILYRENTLFLSFIKISFFLKRFQEII